MAAISVKNVSKRFKNFTAVEDLSFEVTDNHVTGFLGPNGAGKTTTLRMIVGLSKLTKGAVTVSGIPVVFGNTESNAKIGYLPELPSFYAWMTGEEYLNFIADIFRLSDASKKTKIDSLLKLVDLTDAAKRRISTYSGGMKQRLGIAQALINDPDVLILDEPVSALDPIGRREVLAVIEKLKKDKTILFSTHILSDVDRICDDVVIINHGKLITASPLSELKAKYATPILEVEFADDPSKLTVEIEKEKWASKVEKNGNQLKIWLHDNKAVEQNLPLHFLAKQDIGILRYGLTLPETEDLFMDLLGEKHE